MSPWLLAAYLAMTAGNGADLATTQQAFQRGAHEGNGLTSTTRIGPLAASKVSFTVGLALAMRLLDAHGHPTAARVLGFVDGGVTFGVAAHNFGVGR